MAYQPNPNHTYVAPKDYPINVPIRARFTGMKYFKDGIILDTPDLNYTGGYSRRFYYVDSKGKQTFRTLTPDMEIEQ